MPFPIAAAIAGGAALAGSVSSALSNGNVNKKNMAYQKEMYAKQLADSRQAWDDSNEYNSPQKQMERLQQAGLNPNLIYGSGGQTGGTASPMPTPSGGSYNHKATSLDLGGAAQSAFDTHFNTQIKAAQLDNLKAQNTVLQEEALLKQATRENLNYEVGVKTETRPEDVLFRQQKGYKMAADHTIRENEADIILATKPDTIQKAAETILNMRMDRTKAAAAIKEIEQNVNLKSLDENLRKMGVNSSDPIYFRLLAQILANLGISLPK